MTQRKTTCLPPKSTYGPIRVAIRAATKRRTKQEQRSLPKGVVRSVIGGLVLASAVTVASASGALASDRYNWTGFYFGAGVGYGSFDMKNQLFDDRINPSSDTQDTGGKGGLFTAIVGADYQIMPGLVIGAFVDYDRTNFEGEWRDRAGGLNVSGQLKQSSAWAAGGRLGVLTSPSTLLFVSGGWTQAKFDQLDFTPFGAAAPTRFIPSQSLNGAFVGVGAETKVWDGLSLRLEYRYSDFGDKKIDRLNTATGAFSTEAHEDLSTQSIRAVLTHKFGGERHAEPLK